MGTPQIEGPPFTAQMMPDYLTDEVKESLATFLNLDSMGQAAVYSQPSSTAAPTTTAAPSLVPPVTDLGSFYEALNTALNALKQQLNFADQQQSLLNIDRWRDISDTASAIAQQLNSLTAQSKQEEKLFATQQEQILTYNAAVEAYNTALSEATAFAMAMYQAQQDYLSSTITPAEYNDAVAIWNSTVTAQNATLLAAYDAYEQATATFNAQVAANNITIVRLNQTRASLSLGSPIPAQPSATLSPSPAALPDPIAMGSLVPPYSIPPSSVVPAGYPTISSVGSEGAVSTTIDIAPISPGEQALFDSISAALDAINDGSLTDYNNLFSETSPYITAMNTAIINYRAGSIDYNTYNAIVNDYNTYAATANPLLSAAATAYIGDITSYNAQLTAINQQIADFNLIRSAQGLPKIPTQSLLSVPTVTSLILPSPIPTVAATDDPLATTNPFTNANLALLSFLSPTGSSSLSSLIAFYTFISLFFGSAFAIVLSSDSYSDFLELQEAYRDKQLFVDRVHGNLLPNNAYVERFPQQFIGSSSGAGTAPGVGMITSSVGLENVALGGIISQSLFLSLLGENINLPPKALLEGTAFLALEALQRASLLAALPALALLKANLDSIAPGSQALAAALALTNLKALTGLIASGALEEGIISLLSSLGLSSDEIASISGGLAAALTLGLLQTGVFQVSRALSLPGLSGQFSASLFSDTSLSNQLAGAATPTIQDTFNNPLSTLSLKSATSEVLINQGTQAAIAQQQANDIVNRVVQNRRIQTDQQLRAAVISSYLQEQSSTTSASSQVAPSINYNRANELAAATSDFVRRERLIGNLDYNFSRSNLAQQSLQNDLFLQQDLQNGLSNLSQESIASYRDFNSQLRVSLQDNGLSQSRATELADQATLAVQPERLRSSFNSDNLNQSLLQSSLSSALQSQGTSAEQASAAASAALDTVLADNFTSALLLQEAITRQLTLQGFNLPTAEAAVAGAIVVPQQTDLLRTAGNGQILSLDQLTAQLVSAASDQLKIPVGRSLASNIADQLAFTLLGAPLSSQQVNINDINNSASAYHQAKNALEFLVKTNGDKVVEAAQADFTAFIKPSIDLFDLSVRYLDPANSLVLCGAWGIMYSGTSSEPSNFKKSIDILI